MQLLLKKINKLKTKKRRTLLQTFQQRGSISSSNEEHTDRCKDRWTPTGPALFQLLQEQEVPQDMTNTSVKRTRNQTVEMEDKRAPHPQKARKLDQVPTTISHNISTILKRQSMQ